MKSPMLILALSLFSLGWISCGKGYDCKCPSGKKLKVYTTDELAARNQCIEQSNGLCHY